MSVIEAALDDYEQAIESSDELDEDGREESTGLLSTARTELAALRAQLAAAERMVEHARGFMEIAAAAVSAHENKGKGGQQVPYHGDFAALPPSGVVNLRWWANAFGEWLGEYDAARGGK